MHSVVGAEGGVCQQDGRDAFRHFAVRLGGDDAAGALPGKAAGALGRPASSKRTQLTPPRANVAQRDGWSWSQLIAIYSILQTANFAVNHTTWVRQMIKDASTVSFVQVLVLVSSHALWYLLQQLSGRHWGTSCCLRRHLTRVEWRTILGFTLFATLTDLVFLATDNFDRKDVLPLTIIQVALLGTTNWRTLQQLRQIIFVSGRLAGEAADTNETMLRKRSVYQRHLLYHCLALAFQSAVIVGQLVTLALVTAPLVSTAPHTVLSYTLQATYFSFDLFWILCNIFRLLQ